MEESKELSMTKVASMITYETGVAHASVMKVLDSLTTLTAKEVVNGGSVDSDSPIDFCLWESSRSKADSMRIHRAKATA